MIRNICTVAYFAAGLSIAFAAALGYGTQTNEANIKNCNAWLANRHTPEADGEIKIEPGNTICFDGKISDVSAAKIVQAIETISRNESITIVARSIGGDAEAGLQVGALLSARNSSTVVHTLCASSCANYLFLMARHRIIGPSAIVAFHGGLSPMVIARARAVSAEGLQTDSADSRVQAQMLRLTRAYKIQKAILARLHIRSGFLEWFDAIPQKRVRRVLSYIAKSHGIFFRDSATLGN